MAKSTEDTEKPIKKRRKPARTTEARERRLISMAYDVAEEQLLSGNISATVLGYLLKIGAAREQMELEKLRNENALLEAKTEAMESAKRVEELYSSAIEAFKEYRGDE